MKNRKFILASSIFTIALISGLLSTTLLTLANEKDKSGDYQPRITGSALEIHIFDNGKVLVRGAKVLSVGSSSFTAVNSWGSSTLSWTVNTGSETEFIRRYGGKSNIAEISVGDYVSFNGVLVQTASSFTVDAKAVKDWSVQKARASFTGVVTGLSSSTQSFTLNAEEKGIITVNVTASTTIMKGTSTVLFGEIKVGGRVRVSGLYNNLNKVLSADEIKIYLDRAVERHVFEGKLTSIASTTLPVSIVVKVEKLGDTKINIATDTKIWNQKYAPALLVDFRVGDKIRVYGSYESGEIDAEAVRNTSLPR